ncbi:MAG: hypothetical protein ACRC3Y_18190, partial [Romboutsia sp.]|uniref:hypothetical protein n=1 Tax=Romboutsia sp. TaxID=1965302 RepID=UPI003F3D4BA7
MLDTKLKSNKYIINIVVVIAILIASVGMCLVYPRIEKESDKFGYNVFEEPYRFLRDINKINHTLYFKINEGDEENKNQQKPSDVLLDLNDFEISKKLDEGSAYESEYSGYIEEFNNEIYANYENLSSSFKNLHYYAVNENNIVIQNKNGKIEELVAKEKNSNTIKQLKEDYRFYMVVDFDKKGNMKISNVHGANKETVSTYMEVEERKNSLGDVYTPSGVKLSPIKNMKFVYAVPKNIV